MKYRNYAIMVKENSHYPVSYTIKQDGTKVIENTMLKGGDMTENQIKELFFLGYFEEKPTLEEVAERLKGKELFKESNDRARKVLSEIKSLPKQERSYSEEEVLELIKKAVYKKRNYWREGELDEWFEQFKKK